MHVRMEGYEEKWRGCIEEDWTAWIGSKTLSSCAAFSSQSFSAKLGRIDFSRPVRAPKSSLCFVSCLQSLEVVTFTCSFRCRTLRILTSRSLDGMG